MIASIKYTDDIKPPFSEVVFAWFIRIKPEKKGDEPLLAHAMYHVGSFWRDPLGLIWYKLSKKYRLNEEVGAYKAQLDCYPESERDAKAWQLAGFLSTRYKLDITQGAAKLLLIAIKNNA